MVSGIFQPTGGPNDRTAKTRFLDPSPGYGGTCRGNGAGMRSPCAGPAPTHPHPYAGARDTNAHPPDLATVPRGNPATGGVLPYTFWGTGVPSHTPADGPCTVARHRVWADRRGNRAGTGHCRPGCPESPPSEKPGIPQRFRNPKPLMSQCARSCCGQTAAWLEYHPWTGRRIF